MTVKRSETIKEYDQSHLWPCFFSGHDQYVSLGSVYLASVKKYLKQFFKRNLFLDQDSSSCILIVARSLLLPAGEGDDRVWWQAKAWLARVVPSPSRLLPSRAYGWRQCYPLAPHQQSITFAHTLSTTTPDWKTKSINQCFVWVTLLQRRAPNKHRCIRILTV